MKKTASLLVAAFLPLVAGVGISADSNATERTAQAPMSDDAYCHALMNSLRTWGTGTGLGGLPVGNETAVAIAQCQEGQPAAAIPILEQQLRDRKIDLPPRT